MMAAYATSISKNRKQLMLVVDNILFQGDSNMRLNPTKS